MKTFHSVVIGGLMALSLAACSSTGAGTGAMSDGSSAGGATTSGGDGAGAGGSNNATNTALPATPPALDGVNPPANVPGRTSGNGVDNSPSSR